METTKESLVFNFQVKLQPLVDFLTKTNDYFQPRLDSRIEINSYAEKLIKNAIFAVSLNNGDITGICAVYANDYEKKSAYIPLIAVLKSEQGKGTGKKLMQLIISYLKQERFRRLALETWEGSIAETFYKSLGFRIGKKIKDEKTGRVSLKMELNLGLEIESFDFAPTPLVMKNRLGNSLGINLYIKHDDLFPIVGGGSKGRKLHCIFDKAIREGYNAVVTTGSNQSNHVRSTALMAAQCGWDAIMVIHDNQPEIYTGNLKITSLTGAELRFVDKRDVKSAMDQAMQDFAFQGFKPLYVWGGGHSVEGAYAYFKAIEELSKQLADNIPDYIVVASGTGATQAGMEIGVKKYMPTCKVLGISVAREKERGTQAVYDSMIELNEYLDLGLVLDSKEIHFDDDFMGKGYEDVYPELLITIANAAKQHGLILDPTYTGKAFHAMVSYTRNGQIPADSKIVFWHTGGLLNLIASDKL